MKSLSVISILGLCAVLSSGCATLQGPRRVLYGTLLGAAAGSVGGMLLSPNAESRSMNGLVFGLSGALVGGGVALYSDQGVRSQPEHATGLKALEARLGGGVAEYQLYPEQKLPEFLKDRIQPIVIEEFVEKDRVSEEGTLHEPHKVYRIKKPAELFASPASGQKEIRHE